MPASFHKEKRINQSYHQYLGFPIGSEESTLNARATGDASLIPGSGRCPRGRHGNPLQYSFLENPTDRGALQTAVHGGTKELDTT